MTATLTERKIAEMLTENTGAHFLDSGSAYGRNWERNQKKTVKDFQKEDQTTLKFDIWKANDGKTYSEIILEHDIFHWLKDRLEYDPNMQRRFSNFCSKNDLYADMGSIEPFLDYLRDKGNEVNGLYNEGDPITDNIYNHENLISQVFQYTLATINGDSYIFLAIHGVVMFEVVIRM